MRENRTYGSEGGGTETNRFSLPLSATHDTYSQSDPYSVGLACRGFENARQNFARGC